MSVFAKIFIVINLFLSILFLGVSATVLTQRADYKRLLEEKVKEIEEYKALAQKREEDSKTRNDSLVDDIKNYQRREEDLERQNDSLQTDLLKVQKKFDQQYQLFVTLDGTYQSQTRALDQMSKRNQDLNQQLEERMKQMNLYRDAMERAKNQAYAAMSDNQRLQDEIIEKTQKVQDIELQLNEFKSKIEHLKAQGIDVERLTEVKVPKPLDGKIVAVHGGVGLVMVNLGEKHGVEKGMNFTVYRGETYVGQIIVEEIFPDMASARIDPRFQKEDVREGDDVTTRIR